MKAAKASVSPHTSRSTATSGAAVLANRLAEDESRDVIRGFEIFAPKSNNADNQLAASRSESSKAQASVIRCPLPVCIAENRLEQRGNFIEKAAALLTWQRGRERIGECV